MCMTKCDKQEDEAWMKLNLRNKYKVNTREREWDKGRKRQRARR